MYSDLRQILKDNGLYPVVELKSIHGSCCIDSTTKVVDFAEIKSKAFAGIQGLVTPKSVSAITFSHNNRLCFIQTCDFYNVGYNIATLNSELANGEIQTKILGTRITLGIILNRENMSVDFDAFFILKKRDKIDTIILVNLSDHDYVILRTGSLDRLHILTNDPIQGETKLVDCKDYSLGDTQS